MDQDNRVVVLIDMDCFYCQVEEKLNPDLRGKPIAVVQYNPWKGGGIIAVNYEARALGVTRHMRGDEAKEKCPEIQLPSVPCQRGKADISKYREAGKEVARVLQKYTGLLERASIDEAYLDITTPVNERLKSLDVHIVKTEIIPNTFALGYDNVHAFLSDVNSGGAESIDFDYEHAKRLLIGAVIVSEIREAVYNETGYRCSAGIAHNKILAKLVCGMNKPNKQTVLPKHSIDILYKTLSLKKVKHLGGKFGDAVCSILKIKLMSELQKFSEKELQAKFDEKNGTWLYNIARGIDLEPVQARFNPKSIGCCKQLRGKSALTTLDSLRKWLKDLGDEIDDRLEKDALENSRTPKQMVVSYSVQISDGRDTSSSKSYNFTADDELCAETFSSKALELVWEGLEGGKFKDEDANKKLKAPITFLGISVGKFQDNIETKKTKRIVDYFTAGPSKDVEKYSKINKAQEEKSPPLLNKFKKIEGKDFIMKKFFQVPVKDIEDNTGPNIIETTLDKQESFFAKILNSTNKPLEDSTKDNIRSTTPMCEIIKCGEDSNNSDYSGSTINNEINQSINLFEEDPKDMERVSNIRQLLNSNRSEVGECVSTMERTTTRTPNNNEVLTINKENMRINEETMEKYGQNSLIREKYVCPECNKTIQSHLIGEHSDYHVALKLREEERRIFRIEKEKTHNAIAQKKDLENTINKKKPNELTRNDTTSSISKFLMKIDIETPTKLCTECGKRVVMSKFSEHLDFHEAQKLSRELNRQPEVIRTNTSSFSGSGFKRKKNLASPMKKTKLQCKSIESFFK